MASSQTTNYGLNQWAAEDKVLRKEFNEDNAKVDMFLEMLAAKHFIIGTYVGDGTSERLVVLPFTPQILVISGTKKGGSTNYGLLTFVFDSYSHQFMGSSSSATSNVKIVENGFILSSVYHNDAGFEQHYFAARL